MFRVFERNNSTVRFGLAALLLAVVVIVTAPTSVQAQAKVGTTGAQFLELGVSARAMGVGDAYVAAAEDISAVFYNPAGLTSLYGKEAMFTYVQMPADVQYGFAAFGMPLESIGGVLGVGVYGLTSGEIVERTYDYGSGTGRTFAWNDIAITLGYGRYLTDRFSLGVTMRYIGEFVHEYSTSGWSADVGVNYNTGYRGFKLAMAITNFGPDLKLIEKEYPLPINFKFGSVINVVETDRHIVTLMAEGSHPADNLEKYNAGMEYTFNEMFSLRVGSRFNYDVDGLTFGGGMMLPLGEDRELRIDYAYQDFGILTEVHRFTLGFAF